MADLSGFPITRRWPPRRADVIQLYSLPTPNGVKASIMLGECGLDYDVHRISIGDPEDQMTPEFLSLNPNNKIPAIIDPDGPDGAPIGLLESGAILIYLAEKSGRFGGTGAARHHVHQWLMWQMGGLGPMFGQMGFFVKFAGAAYEDTRPRDRFVAEARDARALGYAGKLAIHPAQVGLAATAFHPTPEELDWGRRLLAAFDAAGGHTIAFEGLMVDEVVAARARALVAARRACDGFRDAGDVDAVGECEPWIAEVEALR